jgi:ferritin-like metal-binding protein YciE
MKSLDSLHDVFVHELRDLYSAERQLLKALPKMAKNTGNAELAEALSNHLEETRNQVSRLEEILGTLGEKKTGVSCRGMQGLIEEGDEVLQMGGVPAAVDAAMIGAAHRVEHYEIAAYASAISHAHAQGHTEAARLLGETLKEEQHADELLTKIGESNIGEVADSSTMGAAMSMAFPRMHTKPNGRAKKANSNGRKTRTKRAPARKR